MINPKVMEEAEELDRAFEEGGEFVGPLYGIPVLVKDQAETAGIRTTFGSVAFENYVPEEDATADPEEDPDYHRGLAAREDFRRSRLNVMTSQNLDALVYPNSQVLPPTRKELDDWKWTVLTFPINALIAAQADLLSVSLPAGFAEGGVPVGFELVGKPYGEAELLGLAHAYEMAASPRKSPESTPPLPDEPQ